MGVVEKIARDVDTAIMEANRRYPRVYLGLSYLGEHCVRKIFFLWRFASFQKFSPRVLRLFDRGDLEESRFVNWLRAAGYPVVDRDSKTGQQFEFIDYSGHVKGHADGYIFIRKEKLLLEMKTHNSRSFSAVKRANNIKVSKFTHYCQMQSYIARSEGVERGLYCAINKDNDALHFEIVESDKETQQWLDERAIELLTAKRIPDKISEDSSYWICNMCDFNSICFSNETINRSCRMCKNVDLCEEGVWTCTAKNNRQLRLNEQLKGCRKFELL